MSDKIIFDFYSKYYKKTNRVDFNKKTKELCEYHNSDDLSSYFLNQYIESNGDIKHLEEEFTEILQLEANELRTLIINNIKPLLYTHLAFINSHYNISERLSFINLSALYLRKAGIHFDAAKDNDLNTTNSFRLQKVLSRRIGINDEYINHIKNGLFFEDESKVKPTNSLIKYYADICYYILDSTSAFGDEDSPNYSIYKAIKKLDYSELNNYNLKDIGSFYDFIDKDPIGNRYLQLHFLEKLFAVNLFKDILRSRAPAKYKNELAKNISSSVSKYGYNEMHKKILYMHSEKIYNRDVIEEYKEKLKNIDTSESYGFRDKNGERLPISNIDEYCKYCISLEDASIISNYKKDQNSYIDNEITNKIESYFYKLSDVVFEKTLLCIIKYMKVVDSNKRSTYIYNLFDKFTLEEYNCKLELDTLDNANITNYYYSDFIKGMVLKNDQYMLDAIKHFDEIINIDIDKMRNNILVLYEFERILYISEKIKCGCQDQEAIIKMIDYIEETKNKIESPYVKLDNTKEEMKLMLTFTDNIKIIQRKIGGYSFNQIFCDNKMDKATKYLTVYRAIVLCKVE